MFPLNVLPEVGPMEMLLFFAGTFVTVFSIVNPLLAIPVFTTLTAPYPAADRAVLAQRASLNVFGILAVFFVTGTLILGFFGISIHALRIAGGLMILMSAMGMLNKKERLGPEEKAEASEKDDIAFSPLAMPLMSGPGAIAVIIGLTTDATSIVHYLLIVLVIALVSVCCFIVLRLSDTISQRLGKTLMQAFSRIMGFILLCVGVQFIVNGIQPVLLEIIHGAAITGM